MDASSNQLEQTYAYQEGGLPALFNWHAFLNPEREARTEEDWALAVARSASWVTCACGHQCAVLPRDRWGEPDDALLANCGWDFYRAIQDRDLDRARELLSEIERRSTYLLAEPGVLPAPPEPAK